MWRPPKLSNGGGEVVDHSSDVASQGLFGGYGSFESAPYQIEQENQLRGAGRQSSNRDEFNGPVSAVSGSRQRNAGVPADVSGQTQIMHRHKNAINADKRQPEMPLAERVRSSCGRTFLGTRRERGCKHPKIDATATPK